MKIKMLLAALMLRRGILLSFALISTVLLSVPPAHSTSALRYLPKFGSPSGVLVGPDPNATENPVVPQSIWDNSFAVNLVVAVDEEEVAKTHWIPCVTVDWQSYVENRLVKVGIEMVTRFGFYPTVIKYVTWQSDNSTYEAMLYEMIDEVGWECGDHYNECVGHVLLGITGVSSPYYYGIAHDQKSAILLCWDVYWKDDNMLQHEFSHMLYAEDHEDATDLHYYDDCVMSYKPEYVGLYAEDGWIWLVNHKVEKVFLSNNYCSCCTTTINIYKTRYWYVDNSHSWGGGNKWNPIFPR